MFLSKFAKKVYLLHRRDELRASKPMQKRVFNNEKIEIIWNTAVSDLKGENLLTAIELTDRKTGEISELALNGLFMAIGHVPATKFLKGQVELDERGFIKVTNQTRTSVESVFVAGDVADHHYQQAITAAAAGCKAAIDVEQYLVELED